MRASFLDGLRSISIFTMIPHAFGARNAGVLPIAAAMVAALALFTTRAGSTEAISIGFSASAETLPPGADFTLSITVEGSGLTSLPEPGRPDFGPIEVTGQSSAQSVSIVNLSMKISKTITYHAVAPGKGVYTIPPVSVTYDGKTYNSKPVTITVDPAASSPSPPRRASGDGFFGDPSGSAPFNHPGARKTEADDLLVEMEVDKTKLWAGQQALAMFSFWRSVDLWEKPNYQKPKFEGFWVEEIPFENGKAEKATIESRNGKQYAVSRIKYAIVPLAPGKLTVDPAVVTVSLDPWTRARRLFTKPVEIAVSPLPEEGKPAEFSGMVAISPRLSLKAGSQSVQVDGSISLTLHIEGYGYLKPAAPPPGPKGDWFDSFDPKVSDEVEKSGGGLFSKRTVEYPIIARREGNWKLPPIVAAWFDPSAGKYAKTSLNLEPVTVTRGNAPRPAATAGGADSASFPDKPRYIKPDRVELPDYGAQLHQLPWIWLILGGPIPALLLAWVYRTRRNRLDSDAALKRRLNAAKTAQGKLDEAAAHGQPAAFFAALDLALRGYLADKFNRPAPSITRETAGELLKEHAPRLTEGFGELFSAVEMARYAQPAPERMKLSLEKARELISAMEREGK